MFPKRSAQAGSECARGRRPVRLRSSSSQAAVWVARRGVRRETWTRVSQQRGRRASSLPRRALRIGTHLLMQCHDSPQRAYLMQCAGAWRGSSGGCAGRVGTGECLECNPVSQCPALVWAAHPTWPRLPWLVDPAVEECGTAQKSARSRGRWASTGSRKEGTGVGNRTRDWAG